MLEMGTQNLNTTKHWLTIISTPHSVNLLSAPHLSRGSLPFLFQVFLSLPTKYSSSSTSSISINLHFKLYSTKSRHKTEPYRNTLPTVHFNMSPSTEILHRWTMQFSVIRSPINSQWSYHQTIWLQLKPSLQHQQMICLDGVTAAV